MTFRLLFFFCVALTITPGGAQQPSGGATYDVVFIGDSITAGVGTQNPGTQAAPVIAGQELQKQLGHAATVYISNQGHSGHTTVNFLPGGADFTGVETAAKKLQADHPGQLVFSWMLGTNDSANHGPKGAPLSAVDYARNLHAIVDKLQGEFPGAKFVLNHPTWYSPNTHNSADYEGASAADRLKSYFGAIATVISDEAASDPGHVFLGDTDAYAYFSAHYLTELKGQHGRNGTFYLHPNPLGAQSLGKFWATAIAKALKP